MMSCFCGSVANPYLAHENQDSFYCQCRNGYTVLAVADGAGSLKNSGEGARIASTVTVDTLIELLASGENSDIAISRSISVARDELLSREDSNEVGCTLALAWMNDDNWGCGVVGDAFVVVYLVDGSFRLFTETPPSEFANITKLLTSDDCTPVIYSGCEKVTGVACSSDGLVQKSITNGEPAPGFWKPIFQRAERDNLDVDDFLNYMLEKDFITDDTTLAVCSFCCDGGELPEL